MRGGGFGGLCFDSPILLCSCSLSNEEGALCIVCASALGLSGFDLLYFPIPHFSICEIYWRRLVRLAGESVFVLEPETSHDWKSMKEAYEGVKWCLTLIIVMRSSNFIFWYKLQSSSLCSSHISAGTGFARGTGGPFHWICGVDILEVFIRVGQVCSIEAVGSAGCCWII